MSRRTVSRIMLGLLITGILMLTSNVQPVKAEPRTWTVDDDGPADFHTIQEAINAANPGDTIYVKAGIYYENVIVNKTITLIGESKSDCLVDGGGSSAVFRIMSDNVSISGFTIWLGNYGIYLASSNNCTIFDNIILGNVMQGIYLDQTSYNYISNNIIRNNHDGIRTISSCTNNFIGFNAIYDNTLDGIGIGSHCRDNVISGNSISRNEVGICFHYSYNIIYHNNFFYNNYQVYQHPWEKFVNTWDDGYPSGGNYWSDYTGADLYSGPYQNETGNDGIGDAPFGIALDNVDHYPLINPYVAPPVTYALTITVTIGGTTDPTPGTYSYTADSSVQVTAIPDTNYSLDHWELDGVNIGLANPYIILMDKNHTLKAIFSPSPPPLPVGGYSFPIEGYATEKLLTFYLALVAVLTGSFTMIQRRTHKRTKRP